jgi:hypothetical protein
VSYEAKIIADSISPAGVRLTTLQVTFPRFSWPSSTLTACFSRNSASSRAIPVKKRIRKLWPTRSFQNSSGATRKGCKPTTTLKVRTPLLPADLDGYSQRCSTGGPTPGRLGVHKQLANRLLEPFSWHTVVVTATDWDNFFHLRCHPDAQPEFQKIAGMMRDVMEASTQPVRVESGTCPISQTRTRRLRLIWPGGLLARISAGHGVPG